MAFDIREYIAGPSFAARIRAAAGDAPLVLASGTGETLDAGDPRVTRELRAVLSDLADAAGRPVEDASVFVSKDRATSIVKFATAHPDAQIAVYHDDATGTVECQILSREQVRIAFGSHTLWLIVSEHEPGRVLDFAYGAEVADEIRTQLAGLGLEVSPHLAEDMEYDTYSFPLRGLADAAADA